MLVSTIAIPVLSHPSPINILLTFVLGAVLLPIAASRSGDTTMRRHPKWFGFYAALSFVLLGAASFALPAGAYSLYRSATSLTPLRQLPEGIRAQ